MRTSTRMSSCILATLAPLPLLVLGVAGCGGDGGGAADDTAAPADTLTADTAVEDTAVEDTAATEDTVAVDTLPASCTTNDECGWDLTCHQLDGVCVSDPRCLDDEHPCDPAVEHPLAFVCVEEEPGSTMCRATCTSSFDCVDDDFCGPAPEDPRRARCQPSNCDDAWDFESCGAGNRCYAFPRGSTSMTWGCGPISVEGLVGDACADTSECADGLYCADGTCRTMGCGPSGSPSCPDGGICVTTPAARTANVGHCLPSECDPFAEVSECDAGFLCEPTPPDASTGAVGGTCVARGDAAVGAPCAEHRDCDDGLMCRLGECAPSRYCGSPLDVVSPYECAAGERCWTGGERVGYCIDRLCGLFDDDCDAGEVCTAALGDARDDALHLEGACRPVKGALERGALCEDDAECAPGLACYGRRCEKLCDRSPELSGQGACAGEEACVSIDNGLGVCWASNCVAFVDACEAGETCLPHYFDEDVGAVASCEPAGSAQIGEACSGWGSAECVDDAICLWESETTAGCYEGCNPSAPPGEAGACGEGKGCWPVYGFDGTASTSVGYCLDVCTPWVADGGCPSGDTCVPFDDGSLGTCADTGGTKGEGDICASDAGCQAGLICAGGTCHRICDPLHAVQDDGDTCDATETCVQYSSADDQLVPFGGCYPGCTAGDPDDACGRNEICVARELYGERALTRDFCVANQPVASVCDATNLGALCADGFAICVEVAGAPTCAPLCRAASGELLRVGHPDCADPDAICDPLVVDRIGFCHGPGGE